MDPFFTNKSTGDEILSNYIYFLCCSLSAFPGETTGHRDVRSGGTGHSGSRACAMWKEPSIYAGKKTEVSS